MEIQECLWSGINFRPVGDILGQYDCLCPHFSHSIKMTSDHPGWGNVRQTHFNFELLKILWVGRKWSQWCFWSIFWVFQKGIVFRFRLWMTYGGGKSRKWLCWLVQGQEGASKNSCTTIHNPSWPQTFCPHSASACLVLDWRYAPTNLVSRIPASLSWTNYLSPSILLPWCSVLLY